jgi:uncharacterized membrane protein
MWNLKAFLIVLIFLFSSLFVPAEFNELRDGSKSSVFIEDEDVIEEADMSSSASRALLGSSHGGSWEDSFEDDSKIDWEMSDHLDTDNGEIKALLGTQKPFTVDSNTVALWHFDTGTGSVLYDETINDNDGSILSGATWVTGKYGNALQFDGLDDYVSVPDSNSLDITNIFTLEAWVYRDETGSRDMIIAKEASYFLQIDSNDKVAVNIFDGANNGVESASTIQANEWAFIAVTADGTNVNIFINGVLDKTAVQPTNAAITSNALQIGKSLGGANNWRFKGKIDEVRISNQARSETEILKYFGFSNSEANLTSKPIELPTDMHWDTLLIDKTQPANTYINVTIFDASNNQPIPGSPVYTAEGEFDISFIDPVQYPLIKLNATFEGDGITTPALHFWGVCWNASNAWCDSFLGGMKVESSENVEGMDGNAQLEAIESSFGPDSNTVGMWHFDEGSGTIAFDSSNNNNAGTLGGDGSGTDLPAWTAGKFGTGLSYDGVDDYVLISDHNDYSVSTTGVLTVEFWLKTGNDVNSRQHIISKGGQSAPGPWEWSIWIFNGDLRASIAASNGNNIRMESCIIVSNTWYHFAIVFTGLTQNDDIKIYRNAVEGSVIENQGSFTYSNTIGQLGIGRTYASSTWWYFSGVVDEVIISNKIRTAQEIKDRYESTIDKYPQNGHLISEPINIPNKMYWDTLTINKIEDVNIFINITVIDAVIGLPISSFQNLTGTNIDISTIDSHHIKSIKLKADFKSDVLTTPLLQNWSVNWTKNTAPRVVDITGPPQVYRNNSIRLTANLTDYEDLESELSFDVKYKSTVDVSWQTSYLSTPVYVTDCWEFNFTTPKDAETGDYTFEISCKDSFGIEYIYPGPFKIEVLNNIPFQPEVEISPLAPKTAEDLEVRIIQAEDVETPEDQLEFWYRWYKDDLLIIELDNLSITIQNSAPVVTGAFNDIMMQEDLPLKLYDEISWLFTDPDSDDLTYKAEGQVNVNIDIFEDNGTVTIIPKPNWNGIELITFIANDTEAQAEAVIELTVFPTNDLPVIKQVGSQLIADDSTELEFMVKQDDWINLTVISEDVDGDDKRGTLYYILNISERANLFFDNDENKLVFNPKNADVGWHFIEVKVTDNNETPVEYVSQKIKINVLNVNDPPTVQITEPEDGITISQDAKLTFTCTADDIDLLIPDSTEKLTYRWYTRTPEIVELGTDKELVNPKLPVGQFSIIVEVKDSEDAVVTDSILVNVEKVESETTEITSSSFFWLGIILIIIIIVVLVTLFLFLRKKHREEEVVHPEVVSPASEPSPYTGAPLSPAPAHEAVTAAAPQASVATQVRAELPQTTSPVPTYSLTEESQAGKTSELTPQEKLKKLEERLIRGEIDQDIYRDLKAKLETEILMQNRKLTNQQ